MQITATIDTGDQPITLHLKGRLAWTLCELVKAGETGITTLQNPAPRVSHYVMTLRRKGLVIETVTEKHGGPFPGIHGRYTLASNVTIAPVEAAQ